MLARSYAPKEVAGLDRILNENRGHDVRLELDRIVLAGPDRAASACLIWRPVGLIHELVVPRTLGARNIASGLVSYASADALARKWDVREAAFLIDPDNEPMLRFVKELNAVEETGRIFRIPLR